MTHSIDRSALLSALETCAPVCSKNHINPLFRKVRLDLNHQLRFAATEVAMSVSGTRELSKTGPLKSFGVDLAQLLDAVRRMPDGAVDVTVTSKEATIKNGSRKLRVEAGPVDDLPEMFPVCRSPMIPIPGDAIARALTRTRWATADKQMACDGVEIVVHGGMLRARAINGHCAAQTKEEVGTAEDLTVTIPPGFVPLVIAAAADAEQIRIGADDVALFLEVAGASYRYLTPRTPFQGGMFDIALPMTGPGWKGPTEQIVNALKYVSIALNSVRPEVFLSRKKDSLALECRDSERARETSDEVPIEIGEPWEMSVNPRYLIEAMTAAGDECSVSLVKKELMYRVSSPGFEAVVMGLKPEGR